LPNGEPRPYKGYKGDSNYCMEIVRNDKGKWEGEVVSTFEAYQLVRQHGLARLRHPALSVSGRPLVMRLMIGDSVGIEMDGLRKIYRLSYMASAGTMAFSECHEANVDKRTRSKELSYLFKTAGSLQKSKGRRVAISPAGDLKDTGFSG
jgi:CRISPR-associated endonuclease Csn1